MLADRLPSKPYLKNVIAPLTAGETLVITGFKTRP
jgi:hypothetical protein